MAKLAQAATAAQDEAGRKLVEHGTKMDQMRATHQQGIDKTRADANAKRIEAGPDPMDDDQFQEVTAKLDQVIQVVQASAEGTMQALQDTAEGTMQALQEVARATGRRKKVTTPDGRTYVSEPIEDDA
jgi:hypothetical protein